MLILKDINLYSEFCLHVLWHNLQGFQTCDTDIELILKLILKVVIELTSN